MTTNYDIQKVQAFIKRWESSELREQQGAQSHFNELCELVGHPTPTEQDPAGVSFVFEQNVTKDSGKRGRADVWYKGKFAWEYKGKLKNLDEAYSQLQSYRAALENPPLLVVCDFIEYRIYPQWTDINGSPVIFRNDALIVPQVFRLVWSLFHDPTYLKRMRDEELQRRSQLTEELAAKFAILADKMRDVVPTDPTYRPIEGVIPPPWTPLQVAAFLTRLIFVLFAQKIRLLPQVHGQQLLSWVIARSRHDPSRFGRQLADLFRTMNGEPPRFLHEILDDPIPWFNGGLFADAEVLDILHPDLLIDQTLELLDQVAEADWDSVNPTIVGTLFERALDKSKRSQLGAHYTSEADIRLIIEPVLMQPLRREWAAIQAEMGEDMQLILDESSHPQKQYEAGERLRVLYEKMLNRLASVRVLDPACGSGNFLYVALRAMKDLEATVVAAFRPIGFPYRDVVTPNQFYGIELNSFAARLARVVIWIGYLQWRSEQVMKLRPIKPHQRLTRPDELEQPIIRDQHEDGEHIQNADAILRYDTDGKPYEPEWPAADVIIGNPPFLGGNRIRSETGDKYVDDLFALYRDRVPAFADMVCYWFEKARASIENKQTKRAGLLSTNSIRQPTNREVLHRIKSTGNIFTAWSDREWVLEGASVRISMVGFDDGTEQELVLDGMPVTTITANLKSHIDLTQAKRLPELANICFMGPSAKGPFEITALVAKELLNDQQNDESVKNHDVIRPVVNADDVVSRSRGLWTIDFGQKPIEEAQKYRAPFDYLKRVVYPIRSQNRRTAYAQKWWQYAEARPGMRTALKNKKRFIASPAVSKHRIFIWLDAQILANQRLLVFARDDDYFFGIVSAYPHTVWSLNTGSTLEDRPTYTPTTTFETFPFPFPPGQEPADDPRVQAIAIAAKTLHEVRDAWLNPPEGTVSPAQLRQRTLTSLYNAIEDYRAAKAAGKAYVTQEANPASKIAEQIAALHDTLDGAVLAAYGWSDLAETFRTEAGEEEMLRRLLALNLARAGGA